MTDIQVQVVPRDGARRGDLSGRSLSENLLTRVNDLGDSIVDVARGLRDRLARAEPADGRTPWEMSEVQVTFSLDLQAEAGVIVSRTSAGASFEVAITWSRGAPVTGAGGMDTRHLSQPVTPGRQAPNAPNASNVFRGT